MNASLLLLAVSLPMCCGLLLPEGPRWYYVAQALLVAVLLAILARRGDTIWRLVCWFGVVVQLVAAVYGASSDTGAAAWQAVMALLVCLGGLAELIAIMGGRRCRTSKTE